MRLIREEFSGAHRRVFDRGVVTPLLVGEDNPHSFRPEHALYPYPVGCSGWRFAEKIAGWGTSAQLAAWRTNLCAGRWSAREARDRASELLAVPPGAPWSCMVLLGSKVADAFRMSDPRVPDSTFVVYRRESWPSLPPIVLIPHPSGRSRAWNSPGAFRRAREVLLEAGLAVEAV